MAIVRTKEGDQWRYKNKTTGEIWYTPYDETITGSEGVKARLDDMSLMISGKGNALKADLDDPTNLDVRELQPLNTPVAGDIGYQVATNDPISDFIGNIMGIFKGIINTIGGIL